MPRSAQAVSDSSEGCDSSDDVFTDSTPNSLPDDSDLLAGDDDGVMEHEAPTADTSPR